MLAYWIILLWVALVGFLFVPSYAEKVRFDDGSTDYKTSRTLIWVIVSVPLIICALRSSFGDTFSYIGGFKDLPPLSTYVETFGERKSCQLFYGLETIFKYYIWDDYHAWLSLIALVQIACVIKVLQKYSVHVGISLYLFVASGMIFSWMFNGLKQFLVAAILFACVDWILEKKWIRFTVVLLFFTGFGQIAGLLGFGSPPWWLCGFHQTAIIMLPIVFCCTGKMLNKKVWIVIGFLAFLLISGLFAPFLETAVENTSYENDLQYLGAENGMNIWRFLVSLVLPGMVLLRRKQILEEGTTPIIDLSINMSFVSSVIYLISTVTSGIYVGRLPIYCELYNLILYPWLFMHPYRKEKKWLLPVMSAFYLAFFVYQMYVAFGEPYFSNVLTFLN